MADVLAVDPSSRVPPSRAPEILRRTAPWVRLMSVVMFISCGVMVVGGLLFAVGMAAGFAARGDGAVGAAPALVGGVVYGAMGLINLFPAMFLWRFASRAKEFAAGRAEMLDEALDAQRSYWKFMGLFMIVGLVCAIVFVGIAAVAGIMFMQANR